MGRVYSDEQVAQMKAEAYVEGKNEADTISSNRIMELEAKLAVAEDGLAKRDAHVGAHKRENIKLTAENTRLREALTRFDQLVEAAQTSHADDGYTDADVQVGKFQDELPALLALATKRWKAPEEKK